MYSRTDGNGSGIISFLHSAQDWSKPAHPGSPVSSFHLVPSIMDTMPEWILVLKYGFGKGSNLVGSGPSPLFMRRKKWSRLRSISVRGLVLLISWSAFQWLTLGCPFWPFWLIHNYFFCDSWENLKFGGRINAWLEIGMPIPFSHWELLTAKYFHLVGRSIELRIYRFGVFFARNLFELFNQLRGSIWL